MPWHGHMRHHTNGSTLPNCFRCDHWRKRGLLDVMLLRQSDGLDRPGFERSGFIQRPPAPPYALTTASVDDISDRKSVDFHSNDLAINTSNGKIPRRLLPAAELTWHCRFGQT